MTEVAGLSKEVVNVVHWSILMTSGEFVGRQQKSEISQRLESLTPDEAQQLCDVLHTQAAEQWDKCHGSFNALFDRLNLFNVRELNLFDIIVDKAADAPTETYIRVWKDRNGAYNTCQLLRYNGQILDRGSTETFSDTYEYRFGPDGNSVATIRLRDDVTGVKHARADGELLDQRSTYETNILVEALELHVLPSLEQTKTTLARLWGALHGIEEA